MGIHAVYLTSIQHLSLTPCYLYLTLPFCPTTTSENEECFILALFCHSDDAFCQFLPWKHSTQHFTAKLRFIDLAAEFREGRG